MDIKIHIFSDSNHIGNTVVFVYKTDVNDGYACASVDWSPYMPDRYRLFKFVNKVPDTMVSTPVEFPWNDIENIIRETVNRQSNIEVDNISYVWKNKVDKFIEKSPIQTE